MPAACRPSAPPSRPAFSAACLPLAPTFAFTKLGRPPQPRKLPTVRDRLGKGSAPARERGDRRLDGGDHLGAPSGVGNLSICPRRSGACKSAQAEVVGNPVPFHVV